jgi:dihydropteroate synthase
MKNLNFPAIMGIINITNDSFYKKSRFVEIDEIMKKSEQMLLTGASIIDIGAISSRQYNGTLIPHEQISSQQEIDRLLPVCEKIKSSLDVHISVDTQRPLVMQECIKAGATLINDINSLQAHSSLDVIANTNAYICLMHKDKQTKYTHSKPCDIVDDVTTFLKDRANTCLEAGIKKDRIIIDPGFGFDKDLADNLKLLKHLDKIVSLGYPVLIGISRKSMFSVALNLPIEDRLIPSVSIATYCIHKGASIIRTHDVEQTTPSLNFINLIDAS